MGCCQQIKKMKICILFQKNYCLFPNSVTTQPKTFNLLNNRSVWECHKNIALQNRVLARSQTPFGNAIREF